VGAALGRDQEFTFGEFLVPEHLISVSELKNPNPQNQKGA
jgi:hypothetical protein